MKELYRHLSNRMLERVESTMERIIKVNNTGINTLKMKVKKMT